MSDGVEGLVYPVGNVLALTEALQRVFASPESAQQMGERGLARIANWSFDADVQGLCRALEAVTRGQHA